METRPLGRHAPTRFLGSMMLMLALAAGCDAPESVDVPDAAAAADSGGAAKVAESARAPKPSMSASAVPGDGPAFKALSERTQAARLERFVSMVKGASEPDADFFSDNLVSNETSYLHVAGDLSARVPHGGAYIGVGPEQSFSYLAELSPKVAYIVDIRRDNLRLHLFYKAAFEASTSRASFVALMLGRPAPAEAPDEGDVTAILERATKAAATEETFTAAHAELKRRIDAWGLSLSTLDQKRIRDIHHAFFADQLQLRFSLKEANGRKYPTLGEVFTATDLRGDMRGFLAKKATFETVRKLEFEHRVIPVVGDFAGDSAMPAIARRLKDDGDAVDVFYVSNVEQYLLDPTVWSKWRRNVAALPKSEGAVFLRAWLDQGRAHPRQQKGHRTATFLARMDTFEQSQKERPYPSWWAIANDGVIGDAPGP